MVTWSRRTVLFGIALALGCSQRQAADPRPADLTEVAISPEAILPPPSPPGPTAFEFTPDLAGEAVAKAVTPDVSRPLPAERFGRSPRPLAVPVKVVEPVAVTRTSHIPPTVLPNGRSSVKPSDPPEEPPLSLGFGSDALPARPVLPVTEVKTPRARDVNLPPPAPAFGRRASDRVPFDDPTAGLGNAAVVGGRVKTPPPGNLPRAEPLGPAGPGAKVRPGVPASAEPSAAPVEVSPARVK